MSDYDTDFYTWTQAQAAALRAKDWAALDVDHLAEEIVDLGQSIENAIESHLECLLLHLLKYRYDPATRPRRGWRLTIRHARREIVRLLRKNPGLQHHPAHYLTEPSADQRAFLDQIVILWDAWAMRSTGTKRGCDGTPGPPYSPTSASNTRTWRVRPRASARMTSGRWRPRRYESYRPPRGEDTCGSIQTSYLAPLGSGHFRVKIYAKPLHLGG